MHPFLCFLDLANYRTGLLQNTAGCRHDEELDQNTGHFSGMVIKMHLKLTEDISNFCLLMLLKYSVRVRGSVVFIVCQYTWPMPSAICYSLSVSPSITH